MEKSPKGVHVSIKEENGKVIVPSAFMYTKSELNTKKAKEVTVQLPKSSIEKFSPYLSNSKFFYAFPYHKTKNEDHHNETEELFL